MKALLISDKQEIIDTVSSYLKENNFDLIVYRWLLKALDNIEEIQPDLIFLSAAEYPRHWKTLASFVQSGIGGNNIKLFLYDPEPLSDDDKKKAEELGIVAYINSLSDEELGKIGSNKIISPVAETEILDEKISSVEEVERPVALEKNPETLEIAEPFELIITHPLTGRFIFGQAVHSDALFDDSSDDEFFKCSIQTFGFEKNRFEKNQFIKYVSIFDEKNTEIKSFSATVEDFSATGDDVADGDDEVLLKVKKYYGQEI